MTKLRTIQEDMIDMVKNAPNKMVHARIYQCNDILISPSLVIGTRERMPCFVGK